METTEIEGVEIKKDVIAGILAFGVGVFCTVISALLLVLGGISFWAVLLVIGALFNYYMTGRLIGSTAKKLLEAINSYEYVETDEETKEEKEKNQETKE